MATAKVAMLREEMGRCMRELNTLRVEELEAELLGGSFGTRSGVNLLRSGDFKRKPDRSFHGGQGSRKKQNGMYSVHGVKRGSGESGLEGGDDGGSGKNSRPKIDNSENEVGQDVNQNGDEDEEDRMDEDAIDAMNQPGQESGGENGRGGKRRRGAVDTTEGSSFETIWDAVSQLLQTVNTADLMVDMLNEFELSMPASLLSTIGLEKHSMENLDAMVEQFIAEINGAGSSFSNTPFSSVFLQECNNIDFTLSEFRGNVESFIGVCIGLSGLKLDGSSNRYVRFDVCKNHLMRSMNSPSDQEQKAYAYQMIVVLTRKFMSMATHLVQVMSMFKWFKQHGLSGSGGPSGP
jgi:hypothetical protein